MNKFELELLNLSYNSFIASGDRYFEFPIKNATDLFYYTEAARFLSEEEYIIAISDNIFSESISLDSLNCISFEITDKGIEYIKQTM